MIFFTKDIKIINNNDKKNDSNIEQIENGYPINEINQDYWNIVYIKLVKFYIKCIGFILSIYFDINYIYYVYLDDN